MGCTGSVYLIFSPRLCGDGWMEHQQTGLNGIKVSVGLVGVQGCWGTGMSGYRDVGVQGCWGAGMLGYRDVGVQGCRGIGLGIAGNELNWIRVSVIWD